MSEWETVEGEHWAEYAEHYTRMLAPYGEAVLAAAAPQHERGARSPRPWPRAERGGRVFPVRSR